MRFQFALAALLAMMTNDALASDWQAVDRSEKGMVYVEVESISRSDDLVRTWVKWNYKEPQVNRQGQKYLSERQRVVFRCDSQQYMITSFTEFPELDFQGNAVRSGNLTDEWGDAPPDTIAMSILEFVCKHAPSK